jgi:O-acetylserine/cysteine efflux transporter
MHFKHFLLALFVVTAWGVNLTVIQVGLGNTPPIFLTFSRFFLTCIPLIFFVKKPQISWKAIITYGLIMFATQQFGLISGIHAGVTPALAGILVQAQVFFTGLIAWLFFKEKIRSWQIIGGLFAFSGIAMIGIKMQASATVLGFLLVVGSSFAWSIGNALTRKMRIANPLGLVVYGSLIAWPPLLLLSYFLEGPDKICNVFQNLNFAAVATFFFLSYVTILLTWMGWSFLIEKYSLISVAPFSLLMPIISMITASLFLHEPLPSWKLIAGALVLFGLIIELTGKKLFP